MSDEEEQYEGEDEEEYEEEEEGEDENVEPEKPAAPAPVEEKKPETALSPSAATSGRSPASPGLKSPTPGRSFDPPKPPKSVQRRNELYGGGKPSKFDKETLMRSEGIIPIQAGSNKYASQKGMTGFGRPRDVIDKVKSDNIQEITDEKKIESLKASTWLQSGTNKFASQKGQSAFGAVRDVNYKTKGTGGASEVPEEKARASDGIVPLQSGTNKLASQAGMTGIGMPRIVDGKGFDPYCITVIGIDL